MALAARGAARATLDLDLLTADERVLHPTFWNIDVDVRKGDFDDPLRGVIRIAGHEPIDVVVGRYKWQRDIVERAEPVMVRGISVPVPTIGDLILLKLFAGGYRDLNDVSELLGIGSRDQLVAAVTSALRDLPAEMNERWRRLLSSTRR